MTEPAEAALPARPCRIGDTAPDFAARTTLGQVKLSDFRGRWLVLFSHPADFTPVCTSEFIALAKAASEFEALGCALLGLSVDSLYSHLAWVAAIREQFDVTVPFPIIEDPSMAIARGYGMIPPEAADSSAVRATYFIDPQGVIRAITWYPMTIGRSVDEMLRMVAALQRVADGKVLTPADWRPGAAVLKPAAQDQNAMLADAVGTVWFHRTEEDGR